MSLRLYPAQWQLACETLTAVLTEGRAADRYLQAAFRDRRQMGSRDRSRVTDLVYGVLRDLRRLQGMLPDAEPQRLAALWLVLQQQVAEADLERLGISHDALRQLADTFPADRLTPAQLANVPDTYYDAWVCQYGADGAQALAEAMKAQAPVDLRVNTLKTSRSSAQEALALAGIEAAPMRYAPQGLRLTRRVALQAQHVYRDGWVEPQDEGSQLLAMLVQPPEGGCVIDYCAGAGGKTLALAAAMQDRGSLWALDLDADRLRRLAPRLQRAGVECVRTAELGQEGDLRGKADAVLVDAPCSGTGTWRRQPEARLKPQDLSALCHLQREILSAASDCVKPGGRLVYATCSLMDVENRQVAEHFLQTHPAFEPVSAAEILAVQRVDLPGRQLQLLPHVHGTDGFYGAVFKRRES